MRFRAWYDHFSDTVTVEPDTGSGCLAGIVLFVAVFSLLFSVLNYLSYFAFSIALILIARKMAPGTRQLVFLSVGNLILSSIYCIGTEIFLFQAEFPSTVNLIQLVISIGISVYALVKSVQHLKYYDETDTELNETARKEFEKYTIAKNCNLSAIGLIVFILLDVFIMCQN